MFVAEGNQISKLNVLGGVLKANRFRSLVQNKNLKRLEIIEITLFIQQDNMKG